MEGATTWWPGGDPETYGGLLRDLDEGYAERIVIAVPPGAVWPLPAYELALMTAGQASDMGHDDVTVTVVTPERRALSLFGDEASAAVAEELRNADVELRTGVVARRDNDGLVLQPGGERLDAQRLYAVPRLVGPALEGVPTDEEGFIVAGDDARVEGCERTWAAGDAFVSPLKFGGLATHQARRAAGAIARLAGAEDAPDPGEPVVHGRLLVGRRTRRLQGRGDAAGAPLWWPQGKIAGEYLPRWLTEHGVTPPAAEEPDEGITVHRPISEMRGPELEYLHDLAREFRTVVSESVAALTVATGKSVEEQRLRRTIEASEQERRRWARELHDETLQSLAGLRLGLSSARRGSDQDLRAAVDAAVGSVTEEIANLRTLIVELRPAALDEYGPAAAIENLAKRTAAREGISVEAHVDLAWERGDEAERHTPELESTAYRLVQEALTNAARHAGASNVRIDVTDHDSCVEIAVTDDGRGFDLEEKPKGFGLTGMRERVELAGGQLDIESGPSGTTIHAKIPVQRRAAAPGAPRA